jgi:hypothetical protein
MAEMSLSNYFSVLSPLNAKFWYSTLPRAKQSRKVRIHRYFAHWIRDMEQ